MDKRTLFFVLSLALTLFAVNMFFEQGNHESLKTWNEQQKAKKEKKLSDLEKNIEEHTAKPQDLPIVELYADPSSKEILTQGVRTNGAILTLAWQKELPQRVFVQGESFQIAYTPGKIGDPALYEKGAESTLKIGNLPYFGTYELQLVVPAPGKSIKPHVVLGNYTDGLFSIPALQAVELSKELGQNAPSATNLSGNAIVLMKAGEGYFPVAIYEKEINSFQYLEQIVGIRSEMMKPEEIAADKDAVEKFYVLENEYQQLVFSNYGAALVEINLPFQSESNRKSVVKEIEFDRDMVSSHPANAQFPSHPFLTPGESPKGPYTDHGKGVLGNYYPLLRRDLIQTGRHQSVRILPEYYALNIVSEYPETANLIYHVTYFDQNKITFEASQRNRRITKTFAINQEVKNAPYCLTLTMNIEGDSRGLWLTSGVPEVEWISNATAPALKYRMTRKGNSEVVNVDIPTEVVTFSSVYPDWVCNSNGFLGLIVDPLTQIDPGFKAQTVPGTIVPSRLTLIDEEHERFKPQDLPGYMMMLPLNSKGGATQFRIFAGPFASSILKTVDQIFTDPVTGDNPDYIASQSFHGWFSFISAPFAKFLLVLMQFFHFLTGSWGFSIILLTVALRLMLYPLNAWSTKSMLRMQQIAPEVQRIQEKYKKDPKKVQLEIMNLYRERGVNPVSGCFPLLIQMPFLIGMFDLLKSTFELRGASFIPGWIDNLAAPDVLFSWSTPIFFIGTQFHLLPIILGAVMFLQQRLLSPLPKDVNQMTEQQRQQKVMGNMMTVVFAVMFYHFPSGLNIYWLSSMLLGILQQWWTSTRFKKSPATTAVASSAKKSVQ